VLEEQNRVEVFKLFLWILTAVREIQRLGGVKPGEWYKLYKVSEGESERIKKLSMLHVVSRGLDLYVIESRLRMEEPTKKNGP
jgi:hypothetical protein